VAAGQRRGRIKLGAGRVAAASRQLGVRA
jgi:hypothetical protein